MENNWDELRPRLVAALVNAFDEDGFGELLEFKCRQRLSDLVARDIRFPRKVREVVNRAARAGWLECLVQAARDERPEHTKLQAATAAILVGIEAEGPHFYQKSAVAAEAGIPEDVVLIRQLHPYLETVQRRTHDVPLAQLDESGEKGGRLALARVFIALNVGERRVHWDVQGDEKTEVTAAIGHLHAEH
jgi:hypothetical protein